MSDDTILEVKDLKKHFPVTGGVFSRVIGHVRAVDGVSFSVRRGETLALVGESGCGKTTTGRLIARLYRPTAGQILFRPGPESDVIDLAQLENKELRPLPQHRSEEH